MTRTFADTVFRNGRIYTSNRGQPWVACAAVKAGRFIAVGEERDVASLIGEGTATVDLGGRMAMPGIVDIHNHIMMGGQADLYELRFSNADSVPRIAETLHKAASAAAPGAWIVGGQFGNNLLNEMNTAESCALLDAACLGHPVVLRDDTYHNRWASSAAMLPSDWPWRTRTMCVTHRA